MPPTGTVYSPFAYSLSDCPHSVQAEVRKASPSPLYKSQGLRADESFFCGVGKLRAYHVGQVDSWF